MRYGEEKKGRINIKINVNEIMDKYVKVMIGVEILFKYGIKFYVKMEIIWK